MLVLKFFNPKIIILFCNINLLRMIISRAKRTNFLRLIFSDIWIVGENIIATSKMRNNFCYPLKIFA